MTDLTVIVRIRGSSKVKTTIEQTMSDHLFLTRNLHCVVMSEVQRGWLQKVKDYVTWSSIDEDTLKKLVDKRGKKGDVEKIQKGEKVLFRLHPPRGGFKKSTKIAFPKGELGKRDPESMKKLVMRML